MKTISNYINESSISHLKDAIIDAIENIIDNDEISDEETLKILTKVNKLLEKTGLSTDLLYNDNDGGKFKKQGLDSIRKTLYQKINSYEEIPNLIHIYDENLLMSSVDLLKGDDIYELIDSITGKYKLNRELLEDIAELNTPVNSIAKGQFEILTQLFLSDITEGNKGESGHNGDINTEKSGAIEYKCSGARPIGQGTIKNPRAVYDELTNKIISLAAISSQSSSTPLSINNLEDELDKAEKELNTKDSKKLDAFDCFRTGELMKNYFNDVLDQYPSIKQDNLNGAIALSLLKQCAAKDGKDIFSSKYDKKREEFIKYVSSDDYSIIHDNTCDDTSVKNFKAIMLSLHLWWYQQIEGWDHIIIFAKNKTTKGAVTGKYCVVKAADDMKSFVDLSKKLESLGVKNTSMPRTSEITREWAPTISYIKK